MKKIVVFLLVLGLFFGLAGSALAKDEPETTIVTSDKIFNSDYFLPGEIVVFSGTVEGDLFLAGGKVTFDGQTTGDLFIGAGQAIIRGQIGGNLRVASGQVLISSAISGNALVLAGSAEIAPETEIKGSLTIAGGNLDNQAKVGLGGRLYAGQIYQNGSFGQDLIIKAGQLDFGESAKINGSLNYEAPSQANLNEGQVERETEYVKTPERSEEKTAGWIGNKNKAGLFFKLSWKLSWLAGALVIGWLILKVFPQSFLAIKNLEKWPLKSFGLGVLFYLSFFPLIFILVLTLIGIFFIPLVSLAYGLVYFLAKIFGALAVGHFFLKNWFGQERRGWALLLGLFIGVAISFLPVVSFFYSILLIGAASGALVKTYLLPRFK
ncbi:MAG: hypothetical protein ABIB61_04725 [Candidatus Shapirobacteria bacterium]